MTIVRYPVSSLVLVPILTVLVSGCAGIHAPRSSKRFFETGSGRLYYEIVGAGDPIVLIHGGQMDRRIWDAEVELLSNSHRVIRYDVRGYGRSPAPTRVYAQHEDLAALLDHLRTKKASLVGLSLGGGVAIDFAIAYPDRVNKLVAVAPGLGGFDWSPDAWNWVGPIIEAAQDEDRGKVADLWLANPMMQAAAANPSIVPRVRQLVMENLDCWLINAALEKSLRPPAAKRLAEMKAATLVIVGDKDTSDMQRVAAKLAAEVPGARKIVITGAGHIVNMERPAEFHHAMLDFLGS